jgi:hypothetical protein
MITERNRNRKSHCSFPGIGSGAPRLGAAGFPQVGDVAQLRSATLVVASIAHLTKRRLYVAGVGECHYREARTLHPRMCITCRKSFLMRHFFLHSVNFEDGTDRLSRNVGN